jgi:exodeoxyribonuclease VII large subunit
MPQKILSVTEVNNHIRSILDRDAVLAGVAVQGEISNYKVYPSGHHYFTLKDDGAALKCVMFKSSAIRLRFRPDNGMKVIAVGKISVYPRDGAYQLYCTAMAMDGLGDLYAAFEQLKSKLAAQGLFDPAHKKPIPKFPRTIGIVTSSAGAAVHDMLRILNKRFPLVRVRLLPVRVQGVEAPGEIAAAIRYANAYRLADLLIVGRGGGSIEDLWAFNDERVAHAIYQSTIPVISAVGHEPDVTISDYVADLRAATPSNAAELAVPDQDALRQTIDSISATMAARLEQSIRNARKHLHALSASPTLQSPLQYISLRRNNLNFARNKLTSTQLQLINKRKQRYISLTAALDAMSPLKVLTRGYSFLQDKDCKIIRSVKTISCGDVIRASVGDGTIHAEVIQVEENENGK